MGCKKINIQIPSLLFQLFHKEKLLTNYLVTLRDSSYRVQVIMPQNNPILSPTVQMRNWSKSVVEQSNKPSHPTPESVFVTTGPKCLSQDYETSEYSVFLSGEERSQGQTLSIQFWWWQIYCGNKIHYLYQKLKQCISLLGEGE